MENECSLESSSVPQLSLGTSHGDTLELVETYVANNTRILKRTRSGFRLKQSHTQNKGKNQVKKESYSNGLNSNPKTNDQCPVCLRNSFQDCIL